MKRTTNPNISQKQPNKPPLEVVEYTLAELKDILTEKQKRFCHEYVKNGWNATKAAKIAGYNKYTAGQIACVTLKKVYISQYIQHIKSDYELLCGVSKARQIQEYIKVAYSSMAKFHNTWIELKDWEKIKKEDKHVLDAVESIEHKTITVLKSRLPAKVEFVRIKLYPKLQALERIDKLMGYNEPDKFDVNAKGTMKVLSGNVSDIRKAFGLDKLDDLIKDNGADE